LVAVFEVLTSGSRSSRARRRLKNVVLACRSAGGNATRARSKALFCDAIAPSASFELDTSPATSSRRSATALTTLAPLTRKSVSTRSSRPSSWRRRSVATSDGLRYR
jgi:hypothetical protein